MPINLDVEGQQVGNAFNPEAAIEFNRVSSSLGVPERFSKNVCFMMKNRGIDFESVDEQAQKLAELTKLSKFSAECVIKGRGTFTHASVVCAKLEIGLGLMLEHDMEAEPLLVRTLVQKSA